MTRKNVSARRGALSPSARNVWLASLGAVSLARQQGEKLVTTLVEEGKAIKARGDRLRAGVVRDANRRADRIARTVRGVVDTLLEQATQVACDLRNGLGERLTEVLGRIGVPNRQDLADLTERVAGLGSRVKARGAKRAAGPQSRRRPTAARRKPAAKRA